MLINRNKVEVASTWGTALKIVRAEWLLACIREWRYVDEKDYSWKPFSSDLIDDEDNISTEEEDNNQHNNNNDDNDDDNDNDKTDNQVNEMNSPTNIKQNSQENDIDEDDISTEDEEEEEDSGTNENVNNDKDVKAELCNREHVQSPLSSSTNQSDNHPSQLSSNHPLHLLPNSIHTESDIIKPMISSSPSPSPSQKRTSSSDLLSTEQTTKRVHSTPKEKYFFFS